MMNRWIKRISQTHRMGFALLLIGAGVLIGLLVAVGLNWLPSSQAISERNSTQRAALPPAATEPSFAAVAKQVTPVVVNISTTRVIQTPSFQSPSEQDPFFRFFGDEFFKQFEVPRQRREQSLGSGVIVRSDGYILTNNHVVEKASEIKVLLSDKRDFKGKIIGTDPKTDLAIVKIDVKNLPTIPWADSDRLQVGDYVLAVGNPFGLNQTVTMGIVSAVGRANVGIADYEDFIQTDAAINPGNSGGALVNVRGELVGINTAIFSESGGYMGIGFAIPSNMAKAVMDSLLKTGKVSRGWLGVTIQELTPALSKEFGLHDSEGALVTDVMEDSPAKKAGLQPRDVIISYDGRPAENPGHLRNMVASTPLGKTVTVKLIRDKKPLEVDVKVTELPKELASTGGDIESSGSLEGTVFEGVEVHDLTPDLARGMGYPSSEKGVVITKVEPGSPADDAGLAEGDMILELNKQRIRTVRDYHRAVARLQKDQAVLLWLNRQGRRIFLSVSPPAG
jgi:serine protease Do